MKTPSNSFSKHSSSIPQAMLGGCPRLCLMCAQRCLCGLRTSDFGSVLRFAVFDLRCRRRLRNYLSVACLLTASRSMTTNRQDENPKPNPVKEFLI